MWPACRKAAEAVKQYYEAKGLTVEIKKYEARFSDDASFKDRIAVFASWEKRITKRASIKTLIFFACGVCAVGAVGIEPTTFTMST